MKKFTALALCLTMVGTLLTGCGTETTTPADTSANTEADANVDADANVEAEVVATLEGTVTSSGSSALLPLAQVAAEAFMDANPNASIIVNGGGSGTGLQQVSDGSVDIGNSDVYAEEKLDEAQAAELVDHKVCTVTMAAVVNKSLGIDDLTKQQILDIFTAKVTNWSEVGGPDLEIMLVTRPTSSGTRALFQTWALDGAEEASNAALETDDSGTLLETVQNNEGAIGYVALSYLLNNDTVQPVAIDGIAPTLENTYNGSYLVWGYEHMYTKGDGSELAQAFLSYMMSAEFAGNIEAMGYGASANLSQAAIDSHQ